MRTADRTPPQSASPWQRETLRSRQRALDGGKPEVGVFDQWLKKMAWEQQLRCEHVAEGFIQRSPRELSPRVIMLCRKPEDDVRNLVRCGETLPLETIVPVDDDAPFPSDDYGVAGLVVAQRRVKSEDDVIRESAQRLQVRLKWEPDLVRREPTRGVVFAYDKLEDAQEEGLTCDIFRLEYTEAVSALHSQEAAASRAVGLSMPRTILIINRDITHFETV